MSVYQIVGLCHFQWRLNKKKEHLLVLAQRKPGCDLTTCQPIIVLIRTGPKNHGLQHPIFYLCPLTL